MESLTRDELKALIYICNKECAYIRMRTKHRDLEQNKDYQNALSICKKAQAELFARYKKRWQGITPATSSLSFICPILGLLFF